MHKIDAAGADTVVLQAFDSQIVAGDGRHVLFRREDNWRMLTIGGTDVPVDLSSMQARIDPRAEWCAMADHAWRLDRGLFFNRTMNGTDWNAVHRAYARYLPLLGSRDDVLYLLDKLQSELATSHAFIGGLDATDPAPPMRPARLGKRDRLAPVRLGGGEPRARGGAVRRPHRLPFLPDFDEQGAEELARQWQGAVGREGW